jgi:hypothetical protein
MATNITNTTFSNTYKDDFTDSDNYHRILFNSGRILQARELTQAQTILQKQIERFGNNIFKEGSIVKAGGFVVNNAYEYIKLDTTSNALPADTTTLIGTEFASQDGNNIKAEVIEVVAAEGADPDTLYVKYTYTKDATAGASSIRMPDGVNINNGSITLTTASSNASGTGIRASVRSGIFYVKGHFVFTEDQSIIVSKYTDTYTGDVGFKVTEDVVTTTDDNDLYDNQGAIPNISAPGADRYRIKLTLIKREDIVGNDNFVFIGEIFQGAVGKYVGEFNPYNVPNQVTAERIKENSGDYIVKPFKIKFDTDSADTHLLLKISDGIAVVDGYRVARNPSQIRIPKSRTSSSSPNSITVASFGNYVKVSSVAGNTNGLPNLGTLEELDIQDSADFHGGSTAKLGTVKVRGISEDGSDYRYHLFDINMSTGKSFRNAKSIGSDSDNWFNIIQENSEAVLYEPEKNTALFPLPSSRPSELENIVLTEQRYASSLNAAGGALPALGSNEVFANSTDWVFAKADSDIYGGSISFTPSTIDGQTSGTFTLSGTSGSNIELAYYVTTTATGSNMIRTKTKTTHTASGVTIESDGSGTEYFSIGKPDVISITKVSDSASGTIDYLPRFDFDNGQRDNYYDIGRLILREGQTAPASVYISAEYFDHGASGHFFAFSSYDSSDIGGYQNIPSHTFANGSTISLADYLDFRSVKNTSGTFSGGDAIVHQLPQPNDLITLGTSNFYNQQTGKLIISSEGVISYITGQAAPIARNFPPAPSRNLALYNIVLGANTLNDSDVGVQFIENKRFTMKDISLLEKRIDRLEEAVTLNLLEVDTKNIEVLDSAGNNRTRSGFIADNFDDQGYTATRNPDYAAAIDPFSGHLHPTFNEDNIRLIYDSVGSSNVVLKGDNIYIDYDSDTYLDASLASTFFKINPFDFAQWRGIFILSPSSDEWRDVENVTGKVTDGGLQLDTKQAYLWNNHEWNWNGVALEDLTVGSRTTNQKNYYYNKVVSDERIREVVGERVIDTVLLPFTRSRKIFFKAEGLRPNTQHFAYFDKQNIESWVREETFVRYAAQNIDNGNVYKNASSHPDGSSILVSDDNGTIEGSIWIPYKRFRTGPREVALMDVSVYTNEFALSNSRATTNYASVGVLDINEQDIVNTRVLTIASEKIPPRPNTSGGNNGDGASGGNEWYTWDKSGNFNKPTPLGKSAGGGAGPRAEKPGGSEGGFDLA